MNRFLPDPLIPALLATLVLATLFPASGDVKEYVEILAKAAVMLLFFLHGVKLPRENLLAAVVHWRLHALILGTTYLLLPLLGFGLSILWPSLLPENLWAGVLFLCALPSTVQMSISFTSIAHGNVAASVTSAAASNLLGILLTPLIIGLLLHAQGDGAVSLSAIWKVVVQLLLPFIAGHLLRPLLGEWAARRKRLITWSDRLTILLAVYRAFSEAVTRGIWSEFSVTTLLVLAVVCATLLSAAMLFSLRTARAAGFPEPDARSAMYCGSFKSIITGVPMALVLFPQAQLGAMILPVMIYHQLQAMFSTTISRRQAKNEP
ncbi:MAG: bile acid:sodium symporter family protein [Pseudomonadota bacterium]